MNVPRGPRIKPTIETAADITYSGRRRATASEAIRQLQGKIDAYNAAIAAERRRQESAAAARTALAAHREGSDFHWARSWIKDHGGTVAAALKQTHPDTGGNAIAFQNTQRARAILKRQRPT